MAQEDKDDPSRTTTTTTTTTTRRSSSRRHRVSIDNNNNNNSNNNDISTTTVILQQHQVNSRANNKQQRPNTMTNNITSNDDNAATCVTVELDDDDDDETVVELYPFNGVKYGSYQEMVNAKRLRNQQILEQSGLLLSSSSSSSAGIVSRQQQQGRSSRSSSAVVSKRGILQAAKRSSSSSSSLSRRQQDTTTLIQQTDSTKRRKSSRLLGIESDGLYIDEERAGHITVAGMDGTTFSSNKTTTSSSSSDSNNYYRNRINDGTPISLSDAIENAGTKWMTDTSITDATLFVRTVLVKTNVSAAPPPPPPTTISSMKSITKSLVVNGGNMYSEYQFHPNIVNTLDCNDVERNVAKVCPDRIYSMAVHPSTFNLIVCAGDKSGHVGIWNVNNNNDDDDDFDIDDPIVLHPNDDVESNVTETPTTATSKRSTSRNGVHLFKPHSGAVCCLQWTGSPSSSSSWTNHLVSASYDGTIRMFDVHKEQFIETFATYNNSTNDHYKDQLGYGIEQDYGNKFWTQHICIDPRFNESTCFFISTSIGTAMHIDLRSKHHITFHEALSEKKINTLSLHPNGYSLLSGGLDNTVAVWDVRAFGNSLQSQKETRKKAPEPIAYYNCGRSISSAYFSPSGKYAVTTTMANKLDIFEDIHLRNSDNDKNATKGKNNNGVILQPRNSIRHDNMTGRWLTTFQAIFHPQLDLFVVGSMRQPRCIELFDPSATTDNGLIRTVQGDGLTAVASRLAFHPRTDQLIVCGGNSSGRVTIVRQ